MDKIDKLMKEVKRIREITTTEDKIIKSLEERYQKLINDRNILEGDLLYLIIQYNGGYE